MGPVGIREFIKMLRLLERHSLCDLRTAVERAAVMLIVSADVVDLLVRAMNETPVELSSCGGHAQLRSDPRRLSRHLSLSQTDGGELMKRLEAKSMVVLKHCLKALRLPTIGAECETVAAQAASDNGYHLTYLLQLSELELRERERDAAERRMKSAKFPTYKSRPILDFLARPSVYKMMVLALARCSFIDKRGNVLFIGNPGTGKSHFPAAIAVEACAKGYQVRFFRVTQVVTMLIQARDRPMLAWFKTQPSKLDLLVLDELDFVPATKIGAELLFDVIATAYERSSVLVTTNPPFENWIEALGSERLTRTTCDRLTHRCTIIETKGESYRHQGGSGQKDLRKGGASYVPGANLTTNHVWLFSMRGV